MHPLGKYYMARATLAASACFQLLLALQATLQATSTAASRFHALHPLTFFCVGLSTALSSFWLYMHAHGKVVVRTFLSNHYR